MTKRQIFVGTIGVALVLSAALAQAEKGGKGKGGGKVAMVADFRDAPGDMFRSDGLGPYVHKEHRTVKVTIDHFDFIYMHAGTVGPRNGFCLTFSSELRVPNTGPWRLPPGWESEDVEVCRVLYLSVGKGGVGNIYITTGTDVPNYEVCFGRGGCATLGHPLTKIEEAPGEWMVTSERGDGTWAAGCLVVGGELHGCWYFPFKIWLKPK